MTAKAISSWHKLIADRAPSRLDELLADDAVFVSPVVHTPQKGKAVVKAYLTAAFHVLFNDAFTYVRQIEGPNDAMLEFDTVIDGVVINGVDIITWDSRGQIVEFKVMVRPLKAIQLVHERMARMMGSMQDIR